MIYILGYICISPIENISLKTLANTAVFSLNCFVVEFLRLGLDFLGKISGTLLYVGQARKLAQAVFLGWRQLPKGDLTMSCYQPLFLAAWRVSALSWSRNLGHTLQHPLHLECFHFHQMNVQFGDFFFFFTKSIKRLKNHPLDCGEVFFSCLRALARKAE